VKTTFAEEKINRIVSLIKDRCTLLSDVWANSYFFFVTPEDVDVDSIRPKWNSEKRNFFAQLTEQLQNTNNWNAHDLESAFKDLTTSTSMKAGDVLLPLRIMLVGKKIGPGVFDIAEVIGKEETLKRISFTLDRL
jgi:glutamyl-tRNA synthetase